MALFEKTSSDRYGGFTVDVGQQNLINDVDFEARLQASLEVWKLSGVRGLWFKIPIKHSSLVTICAKYQFDFHHAQRGYVMMNLWLAEDEPNQLPEYANQYIGVGGFVVNDRNQLLVIKERFHTRAHWKLPGGHADKGEDLAETCQREVYEETGVECDFVSLLSFRHQHNYRFGCSDIYFICVMRPRSEEIRACQLEIAGCKWIDLDEYIKDPSISDANRFFAEQYQWQMNTGNGTRILASSVPSFDKKKLNQIYSIRQMSHSQL